MKPNVHFGHISLNSSQNEQFSRQNCRANQNTHFMFSNFFLPENRSVYEIIWENIVERDTDDNTAHARSMLGNYGYKFRLIILRI